MNFAEVSIIPLILLALFVIYIGALFITLFELYNKEVFKKWGSQLMALISTNTYTKAILTGITIIALIIYLIFQTHLFLLIFSIGLGITLSWIICSFTYQIGSKILEIGDQTKRRLLHTLLTISNLALISFVIIITYYLLSVTFNDELIDVYYALITLTFAFIGTSFSPLVRKSGTTYDGIILSTSILMLALSSGIILSNINFVDSFLHLNYTFLFVTVSFLVMVIVTYLGIRKLNEKDENAKNKDEIIKIYNFATLIILGVIFLPLSYVLFKDIKDSKLGGFDLGLLSLIALVLQMGLSSTLDSVEKSKNSTIYFNLLSLLSGAILIILYNYLLPGYGFTFAIVCLIVFGSYMKWYFSEGESNIVSLNLVGVFIAINSLFLIKSLFEIHEGLKITNSLAINSIVPILIGLCFCIFSLTSYKDKGKVNNNWFYAFIFLSLALVVLINTLFGYSGIIYLTLGYSLIMLFVGDQDKDLVDRLYLSLSFILTSLILVEVVYYLNQGVGIYTL
ncbi:TPA: hypothetical protein GXZ54_02220 [bacterium]|nr:hypothetical protein [bacterium]